MRLVYARDHDLTYNSIRFDISLQNFKSHFLTAIKYKKKSSEEYLVTILAVKRKLSERFSCLEFILKNSKHREAGSKQFL